MAYYYIAVTLDKYELPVAVAETCKELSEMLGVSRYDISTSISRGLSGKKWGFKTIKIERGESDG